MSSWIQPSLLFEGCAYVCRRRHDMHHRRRAARGMTEKSALLTKQCVARDADLPRPQTRSSLGLAHAPLCRQRRVPGSWKLGCAAFARPDRTGRCAPLARRLLRLGAGSLGEAVGRRGLCGEARSWRARRRLSGAVGLPRGEFALVFKPRRSVAEPRPEVAEDVSRCLRIVRHAFWEGWQSRA